MGAIAGLLGLGGGAGGSNFQIQQPITNANVQQAYGQTQSALQQQQQLANQLAGQNGIQNQSNVYGQLQNIAAGQGPNPAQAMLNQATSQNVANQAALAAGQRGAASNVGLMARQAAQTGSQAQQQAAGQAATMQAQQSLNALGQAGNIANQQVGQQIGAVGGLNQYNQAQQQQFLNAQQGYNQANAGLAGQQMQGQQGILGGLGNAVGAATNLIKNPTSLFASGGVAGYAGSGTAALMALGGEPQSAFGKFLKGSIAGQYAPQMAEGGKVPVKLTPQEKVLSPGKAQEFAKGGPMKGATVPGKPKHPGKNDYANDTYSTSLKPGSIVIPLESLHSNEDARRFVQATLAKKRSK
jgi:hypothetical protein